MFIHSPDMTAPKSVPFWRTPALISLVVMLLLLTWDFSGGDLKMAKLWGDATGFPLREDWWMVKVMHQGCRNLGWVFFLALFAGIWRPWGALKTLGKAERIGLFVSVLSALLSVTLTKGFSQTSCPWDLQAFGGVVPYVSHWNIWMSDGGGGHCFPAGHASTGFAFMASFFALKQAGAKSALRWLILAMIAGFVLGISQQMRGAHFMSHTLWTAWLCWTMGWLSHTLFQQFFNPLGNR